MIYGHPWACCQGRSSNHWTDGTCPIKEDDGRSRTLLWFDAPKVDPILSNWHGAPIGFGADQDPLKAVFWSW